MDKSFNQLSNQVKQIPLDFHLGGLIVEVINFEYVPPGPNWVVPIHKHSSYEFHFISSGIGYITMDERNFKIEQGQFYMTGPYVYHSQKSDQKHPMDECSLQCQIRLDMTAPKHEIQEAKHILKLLNRPIPRSTVDSFGGIETFFQILDEVDHKRLGYVTSIKQSIMKIILATVRALQGEEKIATVEPPLKDTDHTIVRNCILFLEDNHQDPITINDVASSIYLSPRHLGRVFKTITAKTVMEYLTEIRMTRAKQLIEETDRSLEDIAQECGIANGSYLSTLFRKTFDTSPSQLRKSL